MSGERTQRMRGVLDGLSRTPGIIGATLITRDGLCVINSDEKILSPETFSAMTAALMGAAETAFFELGGAKQLRVTAETDKNQMVALGASEDLLLVVIGNGSKPASELVKQAEGAATQLRAVLGGG